MNSIISYVLLTVGTFIALAIGYSAILGLISFIAWDNKLDALDVSSVWFMLRISLVLAAIMVFIEEN